jgi:sugar phosphate isomerase/epimerase
MNRPITLFTGQWADLPLETLAKWARDWGYHGLELACWGDHFDVDKGACDKEYCKDKLDLLAKYNLKVFAISNHLAGQLICDPNNDSRSDAFSPAICAGSPEKKRIWAIDNMKNAARAARNLGVSVVNGFTGSPIWHLIYGFPPTPQNMIDEGYKKFSQIWNPILDIFDSCNVKFALEVHPTEIAFDIYTAEKTLDALQYRKAFGFNFDPSHLYWQMVNPVCFLRRFHDRIYHVHMKDAALQLDGNSSILASHLNFGDPKRGWDFRSLGHGNIDFKQIIRTLNQIGYSGPLSVEWEDCGMDRQAGAMESCEFVKRLDFKIADQGFESAFEK